MNLNLKDKHVAIAGASKGIGLGIADCFLSEGAKVWLTGRSKDLLEKAALSRSSQYTVCDLTKQDQLKTFSNDIRTKWGKLDVLVLNLGSTQVSVPGLDCSTEDWLSIFNANFFSHVALIKEFKDLISKSECRSIVSISSIAAEMRLPAPLSYTTSKAALEHFCNASSVELASMGIRYNIVSPGNIIYAGGRWESKQRDNPEHINAMLKSSVPLGRFGTPEEIGTFVTLLASPNASFCTGTIVRVDGGQSPVL